MRTMSHQIEDINKEIEIIKRNQIEALELKRITEIKNLLAGLDSRLELAEERINELEHRSIEIIHFRNRNKKECRK